MKFQDSNVLLSRDATAMLKGMAILLMILHHFFGLYSVNVDAAELMNSDAIFAFCHQHALGGKTCVALFALVTGYGYRLCAEREKSWGLAAGWHRIRKFYPLFCLFCLVAIALIAAFPPPDLVGGNFVNVQPWWARLLMLVGYRHYIADYWYIAVVLMAALFLYPLLLGAIRRGKLVHACFFGTLCFLNFFVDLSRLPRIVATLFPEAWRWMPYFLAGWALGSVRYAEWRSTIIFPAIWLGVLILRYLLPDSLSEVWYSLDVRFICSVFIFVMLAYAMQRLPRYLHAWLQVLGACSAVMWLNHRMIFGYWFADYFYGWPTPVNYVVLVLLSFGLAYPVTKGWNRLLKWWDQRAGATGATERAH